MPDSPPGRAPQSCRAGLLSPAAGTAPYPGSGYRGCAVSAEAELRRSSGRGGTRKTKAFAIAIVVVCEYELVGE